MRKLKRKKGPVPAKRKLKKYKSQLCSYVNSSDSKCTKKAVGKGTLCKKHGGNPVVKENLIPQKTETNHLSPTSKFNPAKHPIAFMKLSRIGMSLVEIASKFKVAPTSIKSWAEKYESFAFAYEMGQAMHEAWWLQKGKNNLNARDFNTTLFKFLTGNKLGYSDKIETKSMNLNVHGVLKVPDSVTEDEWENEEIVNVSS